MNKLTYFVNNNGTMEISQNEPNGKAIIHTFHDYNDFSDKTNDIETVSYTHLTLPTT